jgi:hypothetical protein
VFFGAVGGLDRLTVGRTVRSSRWIVEQTFCSVASPDHPEKIWRVGIGGIRLFCTPPVGQVFGLEVVSPGRVATSQEGGGDD